MQLLPDHGMLAQAETTTGAPDTVAEVKDTLTTTLGEVWKNFLEHTPFLVAGLILLFVTWALASLATRITGNLLKKKGDLRHSMQALIVRFISILVWAVGLLITAMVIFPGLTPAKALGGLGLLSVAVGFAFKDIFENFFAGILLLWRFPFENGDIIECEDVYGRVEDIQIRMSLIRKTTGELVIVPNSFLFMNAVEVLTDKPNRRVHLTTGVGYGEDVGESVEVIRSAVESCATVNRDLPVEIYPSEFGDSSVNIDVAWWTNSMPGKVRASKGEVVTAIKSALDGAGIEIPFPYRTLTFGESLPIRRDRPEAGRGNE